MNKQFINQLLQLYPEYSKITGPYSRKDGRQHIVLNKSELPKGTKGKLKTLSYPKAIMEVHLGRLLLKEETIDHIDKNPLNNEIINLQILSRQEHAKLDVKRRKKVQDNCSWCNLLFTLTRSQLRSDKSGVFCSRSCSGKYAKAIQMNQIKPLERYSVTREYYTNKET